MIIIIINNCAQLSHSCGVYVYCNSTIHNTYNIILYYTFIYICIIGALQNNINIIIYGPRDAHGNRYAPMKTRKCPRRFALQTPLGLMTGAETATAAAAASTTIGSVSCGPLARPWRAPNRCRLSYPLLSATKPDNSRNDFSPVFRSRASRQPAELYLVIRRGRYINNTKYIYLCRRLNAFLAAECAAQYILFTR